MTTYTSQDFSRSIDFMIDALDSFGRLGELANRGLIEMEFNTDGVVDLAQADLVKDVRRPMRGQPAPRVMYVQWPGIRDTAIDLVRGVAPHLELDAIVRHIMKAKFSDDLKHAIGERALQSYTREIRHHGISAKMAA